MPESERQPAVDESLFAALVEFALWFHPVWSASASDDVDSAERCVSEYLAEKGEL